MSEDHYTYHIRIANYDHVRVEKRGPRNQNLGQPDGVFSYKGALREQIDELVTAAQQQTIQSSQVGALGEALFNALFDPTLRQDFVNLYNLVGHKEKKLLRVELDIDERRMPEVAALPWEFMRLPTSANLGTVWLGTAPYISFSRRRAQWLPPQPIQLKPEEKLRIALAVAAPENLPPIIYETIVADLQELARNQPNLTLLPLVNQASRKTIDDILRERPHIFHFIGHGRLNKESGQPVGEIALVYDDSDEADWINEDDFSELLNQHHPGIVMLQACEGGMLCESEAFAGVASKVVAQNIPVVVAMQYEVTNSTASRFARRFYERLAQYDPVDQAGQDARRVIALGPMQYGSRDFATPILFMRVDNGRLFERPVPKVVEINAPPQANQEEALRNCLAQLNYRPQRNRFNDVFDRQEKMGAFLISGSKHASPRWLLNLLAREIKDPPGQEAMEALSIDVSSPIISQDIDSLYQELGERLGLEGDETMLDVIAAICAVRQEKDLLIILDNVADQGKDYPTKVIKELWQPLVAQAQQQPCDNWLLLFLIDQTGELSDFANLEGLGLLDPESPLSLPRLNERFDHYELEEWLGLRSTRDVFAPVGHTRNELLEKLLQRTNNGVAFNLLVEACRLCGYKWFDVEKRWMKL